MDRSQAYTIVRERSGGRCEAAIENVCLGTHDTTHHRRKVGRIHTPSNLLAVCGDGTRGCHGWLEAHPNRAMSEGLSVSNYDDPAQISAHMRWENVRSWFVLEEDGTLEWDTCDFEPVALQAGAPSGLLSFYRKNPR